MMGQENAALLIKSCTGYTVTAEDDALLQYLYQSERQHILNVCNCADLPAELELILDETVAGRFLQLRKAAVLGDAALDVVKSIREGDTTVEFGGKSAEQRLDAIIAVWTKERDLLCFRRLRW
ncbi:hypothetical protein [Selenomonas noxia]|uniref:hypothetical protein n=1 Tax=Selenomonas noxia TaxID=135083 RepID=UPI00288000B1|nr:hypothetical protein [Selenomonas noxia]